MTRQPKRKTRKPITDEQSPSKTSPARILQIMSNVQEEENIQFTNSSAIYPFERSKELDSRDDNNEDNGIAADDTSSFTQFKIKSYHSPGPEAYYPAIQQAILSRRCIFLSKKRYHNEDGLKSITELSAFTTNNDNWNLYNPTFNLLLENEAGWFIQVPSSKVETNASLKYFNFSNQCYYITMKSDCDNQDMIEAVGACFPSNAFYIARCHLGHLQLPRWTVVFRDPLDIQEASICIYHNSENHKHNLVPFVLGPSKTLDLCPGCYRNVGQEHFVLHHGICPTAKTCQVRKYYDFVLKYPPPLSVPKTLQ